MLMTVNTEQSRHMPRPEDVAQVRPRRNRLGMKINELAQEAGISRDTLSDLEAGNKKPQPDTVNKVLTALDRIEREVGLNPETTPLPPGVRPVGDPTYDLVEFTIEGNFGVRAVVRGPISDIDALRKAAADLIAGMNRPESEETT